MDKWILVLLLFLNFCQSPEVKKDTKVENETNPLPAPTQKEVTQPIENKTTIDKNQKYNLIDVYKFALSNTERISLKREAIVQSQARKDLFYSQFFPTLSYRYQRFFNIPDHTAHDTEIRNRNNLYKAINGDPNTPYNPFLSSSGSSSSLPPSIRPGSRLVLHIPIMTGLNEWVGYKSAQIELKSKQIEYQYETQKLFIEIARAYYNILQLEDTIENRQKFKTLSRRTANELSNRVKLGKNKRSEYLNMVSKLDKLDLEIESRKNLLKQMKEDFAYLTGLPVDMKLDKEFIMETKDLDSLDTEKQLAYRTDVHLAKANLEYSKSELIKAYGGHLPTIAIDSYYTLPEHNQPRNKDIFNQLVVQIPLLSVGTVSSQIKIAESNKRQAEMRLSQTIKFARDEINKAYLSYKNSIAEENSYKKLVRDAEETYRAVNYDYSLMQANTIELLDSMSNLQTAKEDLSYTSYQKKINKIWLHIAAGNWEVK